MRAYRWLVALVFMAGGLHAQTVGSLASSACPLAGCAQGGTGTVTTTGILASGQVALGSGPTSITGDSGATYAGTAGTTKFTIGGITFGGSAADGTGLYLSAANTLGFTTNGTERWVMNASGALNPTVDATYDIGTSLVRPRDITISRTGTFGTSVVTPLVDPGGTYLTLKDNNGSPLAILNSSALYPGNDNTYSFGKDGNAWANGVFGTKVQSPLLTSGPGKSGTNVAGTNATIQAEPGTGSATGSSLIFQTPTTGASGTGAQTQTTRLTVSETNVNVTGTLGIGVASPVGGISLEMTTGLYSYGGSLRNDSTSATALNLPYGGGVFGGPVRLKGYTVATLPAGTVGDTAYVTDALAPAFGVALVGGGAVVIPAFYDGANWIAH